MITAVIAKDIKGATFELPVSQKTLVTGRVGSGKTTISNAIAIALLGYYPAGPSTIKQQGAIFDAFSSHPESMTAGVILSNGTRLERTLAKTKTGSITEKLTVNGKKTTKNDYAAAIGQSGAVVFDSANFTDVSAQKKAEMIFGMFKMGDTSDIEERIEDAKTAIRDKQGEIRNLEQAIEQQRSFKINAALPPGNLSTVRQMITDTEAELEQALKDYEAARIDEEAFKKKQAEEAVRVASDQQTTIQSPEHPMGRPVFDETVSGTTWMSAGTYSPGEKIILNGEEQNIISTSQEKPAQVTSVTEIAESFGGTILQSPKLEAKESIQKIINAMLDAGCGNTCAAMMVAKKEMKKFL